jgi:hypothetical protein
MLIRVGTIFIVSGILVGLLFSEWFPILLTGTLLLIAEQVRRLFEYHEKRETTDPIRILQLDQEEI